MRRAATTILAFALFAVLTVAPPPENINRGCRVDALGDVVPEP